MTTPTPRARVLIASIGLAVLSALYCLPGHPSAGRFAWDAVAHVALFAAVAFGFGWATGRGPWIAAGLVALAALLEVGQWWLGDYRRVEVADILANEAGLALAWATLALRHRHKARDSM